MPLCWAAPAHALTPGTVFQLSGLAWNSRYNLSHVPDCSSVGTHCCRFAVMLHIWSTGTSGQLLREGRSSAGVRKQEGQGNSWRISGMSRLSPCPQADKTKLLLGGKWAFSGEMGHAQLDVPVAQRAAGSGVWRQLPRAQSHLSWRKTANFDI